MGRRGVSIEIPSRTVLDRIPCQKRLIITLSTLSLPWMRDGRGFFEIVTRLSGIFFVMVAALEMGSIFNSYEAQCIDLRVE